MRAEHVDNHSTADCPSLLSHQRRNWLIAPSTRKRLPPRGRKGCALGDRVDGVEPAAKGLPGAGGCARPWVVRMRSIAAAGAPALSGALPANAGAAARPCPVCVRVLCFAPPLQPRRRRAAAVGADSAAACACACSAHASCAFACGDGCAARDAAARCTLCAGAARLVL